jgi:hypothetical protein
MHHARPPLQGARYRAPEVAVFIGHYAVGFAAKRYAPKASLGVLVAAPTLLDLVFPLFLLAGWERVHFVPARTPFLRLSLDYYPWSHSLVAALVWASLFALLYWALTRDRAAGVVIWLGVLSHWVLDALTHRPDMQLVPGGSALVGLGLWNSLAGTVIVEGMLFAGGLWLYARATRPRDRIGTYALWGMAAFLVLAYVGDLLGPPPTSSRAMGIVGGAAGWLLVLWAWWIDRHRDVKT